MNRILQAFAVAYTAVAVLFATAALDQALDPEHHDHHHQEPRDVAPRYGGSALGRSKDRIIRTALVMTEGAAAS